MSASALLEHKTRGRARLRVPGAKKDGPFFAHVEEVLTRCPAVTAVKVNPATASVLVEHRGDLGAVVEHARSEGLFEVDQRAEVADPLAGIRERLLETDEALRRRTDGAVDLRAMGFFALIGGSAYQLLRGDFMPAGGTLLVQALGVLLGGGAKHGDD